MEITEPVILDLAQGRKRVRIELTTRADARDLMKAVERCMGRLPDDGEGLLALVEVRELPEVVESTPIPQSHYCDTGNCEVCGDGTGDVPVSAELLGQLAGSIITGTPITVDDEQRCECSHQLEVHAVAEPSPCLHGGCGCAIFRLAAPKAYPEPPRVVPGAVEPTSLEVHRSVRLLRDGEKLVVVESTPCPEFYPGKFTGCIGSKGHEPPCRDVDGDEWVPAQLAGAL